MIFALNAFMRIATNVSRSKMGGITSTNLALFQSIDKKQHQIVGVEIMAARRYIAPTIFKHLPDDFFTHYVISGFDLKGAMNRRAKTLADAKKIWAPAIRGLKRTLRKEEVDVVLINGTYTYPWLLAVAAHQLKIPIVLRYAGVFSREAKGVKPRLRKLFVNMEKSVAKMADAYIFPSEVCQKVVEKEVLKKPAKNAVIIANPIRRLKQKPKKVSTAKNTIAAIGRWDDIKNFPKYFEIHKELLKQGWDHQAYLITAQRAAKKVPKTIFRVPSMTYDKLWHFYKLVGLVIVPSHFETFNNVAAEAVLAGTPVLVSNQVGFSTFLKKAGLKKMVIDNFDDLDLITKRVMELTGSRIPSDKMKRLENILDTQTIHNKIMRVLKQTVKKGKN